ncbi:wax ester/triacylglycerol synthase domain-containing protein [Tomitella fengzijianii]|uniref:diacylglycerol O-acyltransferase n=1 Tax=Tomitella fengzijianii TaxID=2597660 RepID=A0A516X5M2_9ACTN|nr:wax ester/triacylglycerol synthase domain-containing protein [Tomitella fengzijianii]QDQ98323.1 DUF1298 domain-containing protein [Tomitella fengzijianii]
MNTGRDVGGTGNRLQPRDAEFHFHERPGHRSHLVAAHMFDATGVPEAQLTLEQAYEWMSRRLSFAPFFTRRIRREFWDLDYPYWVPADVDLADHVFVHEVDGPGWAPVAGYLEQVVAEPVDLTRPPWELHVVTGVSGVHDVPGELVIVLLKIHHSAGDGLAVRELTARMYAEVGKPEASPPRDSAPIAPIMAARAAFSLSWRVGSAVRAIRATREALAQVEEAEAAGEIDRVVLDPPTRLNGPAVGGVAIDFMTFGLDDVAAIRAASPGATVNDVLLATVAGGLREYLGADGAPTRAPLSAMVPRSVRGVEQWSSSNQIVLLAISLHFDVDDPMKRLALIAESSRRAKERSDFRAARIVATRKETTPSLLMKLTAGVNRAASAFADKPRSSHTMVSNIALDSEGLHFCGAPHAAVLPNQPPINGDLLRHFLCRGRSSQLTVNVCADTAAVPDLDRYLTLLRQSFSGLKDVALRGSQ